MKYASDFAFFKGYIIERKIKFPSKSQNDTKNSLSNKEKVINNFCWKRCKSSIFIHRMKWMTDCKNLDTPIAVVYNLYSFVRGIHVFYDIEAKVTRMLKRRCTL